MPNEEQHTCDVCEALTDESELEWDDSNEEFVCAECRQRKEEDEEL